MTGRSKDAHLFAERQVMRVTGTDDDEGGAGKADEVERGRVQQSDGRRDTARRFRLRPLVESGQVHRRRWPQEPV